MSAPTLITTTEAGRMLGLSPETVRVMARRGQLTRYYPSGQPGNGLRLDRREVAKLAVQRAIRPEQQKEKTA